MLPMREASNLLVSTEDSKTCKYALDAELHRKSVSLICLSNLSSKAGIKQSFNDYDEQHMNDSQTAKNNNEIGNDSKRGEALQAQT